MEYLPLFMRIAARPCLVVGGGEVALRKVQLLQRAGGQVRVVAPEIIDELSALSELDVERRAYTTGDVTGMALVVAATDDASVNRQVSQDAQALGVLVNVVDSPELCTCVMPSIIDRSPVLVAVSTAGSSPVLARLLRGRIESVLPAGLGALAEFADSFRQRVKDAVAPDARKAFWEGVLTGPIAEQLLAGDSKQAHALMDQALAQPVVPVGELQLVDVGPGDSDLLTLRAVHQLLRCDVAVYSPGLSPAILDRCRRDARQVSVQDDPLGTALTLAGVGSRVVLLQSGPFSQQQQHRARQASVSVALVPGVSVT